MQNRRQSLWEWLLFALSVGYLVFELAFNSRIVDGASGEFSPLRLEALELQGRVLSGIGVTLLALRFVKLADTRFLKFATRAFLTAFFAFGFMFLGQKFLLNTLVNTSSEEARNDAMYIALLKSGVFNGHVQLDDIDIKADDLDSAHTRSMLAIMGVMLFNSEAFITHLKAQADTLIDTLAELDARETLPEAYAGYQTFQTGAADAWGNYANSVNKYHLALASINAESLQKVNDIYLKAGNAFSKNHINLEHNELITKSLEIKRFVSDYFEAKSVIPERCARGGRQAIEACQIKLEDAYRDNVLKQAGRFVAPDYWCHAPEQVQASELVRGRMRTVMKTVQDCTSMTREYIADKLLSLLNGGESFLDNVNIANSVASEVKREGVTLPQNWTLRDRDTLQSALADALRAKIDAEFRNGMLEATGDALSADLNEVDFVALPFIQNPFQDALSFHPPEPISVSLSPEQYLHQIHIHKYREVYEEKRDTLLQDGEYFGDGEPMEADGKKYYKSIIIPPFAMSFSLFFGLLNLMAFIRTLVSFKVKKPWLAHGVTLSGMVLFFVVLPMLISSVTVSSKAFAYFQEQLRKNYPYVLPEFAAWAINTQPMVYPIGNAMAFLVGQQHIEAKLESFIQGKEPGQKPDEAVTQQAKELFDTKEYQIPGVDIPLDEPKSENSELSSQVVAAPLSIDENMVTFYRQNESNMKSHAYSRYLIQDTLQAGSGLMFDISPIEGPDSGKWVAYDKPFYGSDICLPGRRHLDSLRGITEVQWRNGFHGPCIQGQANSEQSLPSLKAVLRTLAKRDVSQPIIVSLQEDLTGEVFCGRYDAVIQQALVSIGYNNVTLSTPSIRILGCLNQAPIGVNVAFEMPQYSENSDTLLAKGHRYFTRAEYQRIKKLSLGQRPTLNRVDTEDLALLLKNHPYVNTLLIDSPLITPAVQEVAGQHGVGIIGMYGRTLKGVM